MQRMYTDIQEPMLNATQEQVEYGPQKNYHAATSKFIIFILRNDTSKNLIKMCVKFSLFLRKQHGSYRSLKTCHRKSWNL